jgi:hypothetical protein
MLAKHIILFLVFYVIQSPVYCQVPRRNFAPDSLPAAYFSRLKSEFGPGKKYPPQFEKQILIALSYYPELKNTTILFRSKVRHATAITRSSWPGIFGQKKKRDYVITISDSIEPMLMPILLKNLPFNAQVGVIGHELGHVVQYAAKNTLQLIQYAVNNISAKYIDRFEYQADSICIAHGLGYQLLEWSSFVRKEMNTENWDGPDYVHRPKKRERYMNPATILKRINEDPLYRVIRSH